MSKATTLHDALSPHEQVGQYDLFLELSQGALGTLWAARVNSGSEEGRIVHVRRVRVGEQRRDVSARLTDAALAAIELRHPAVLAVLDVTPQGGDLYVTGEYLDGDMLNFVQELAISEHVPFAPAVALKIGLDALKALIAAQRAWTALHAGPTAALHSVHGGISPDHILLAGYGEVLLAEFGIRSAAMEFPEFVEQAEVLPYAAPELLDSRAAPDERSDVFSMGVLLWELLANRRLYGALEIAQRGASPFALRSPELAAASRALKQRISSQPIPALGTLDRRGPPIQAAVSELVSRALERDPSRRFASLGELRDAIVALPRDLIATSEQVSSAVERLLRSVTDKRREAIEQWLGSPESVAPGSERPTERPAAPTNWSTKAASATFRAAPTGFATHEAPTRPGGELRRFGVPPRRTLKGIPAVRLPLPAPPPPAQVEPAMDAPFEGAPAPAPNTAAEELTPDVSVSAKVSVAPSAIVSVGPEAAGVQSVEGGSFTEQAALRHAFAEARAAEQNPDGLLNRALVPSSYQPPASLSPSSRPPASFGLSASIEQRRRRARSLAFGIGALIVVVAMIAIARALTAKRDNSGNLAPAASDR